MSWDDIKRYHIEVQGWNDIGYHFGIEQIESSYQILVGRPLTQIGAHCYQAGMNTKSIGVMLCGNYDLSPVPEQMLITLSHYLLVPLMNIFNIPIENIQGHNNYATYKSCPGKMFNWHQFINILAKELSNG
jgi:N-acetylmuramoyl-L-alanine amidase CwlA